MLLLLLLRAALAEVGREEDKANMAAVNARLVFRLLECCWCCGWGRRVGRRGGGECRGSMLLLRAAGLGHEGGDAKVSEPLCVVGFWVLCDEQMERRIMHHDTQSAEQQQRGATTPQQSTRFA